LTTGQGKTFRDWSLDQALLLPPSVHDFVPPTAATRRISLRCSMASKPILGRNPQEASADAGCSAQNLRTLSQRRINGYMPPGDRSTEKKSASPSDGSGLAHCSPE
jgi:hypothetical protein